MLSPKEFSKMLFTLPMEHLCSYNKLISHEMSRRLFENSETKREPPNFEKLPWKITDRLPGNTNIMKKLGWYYPSECTGDTIKSQIKVFTKILEKLDPSQHVLISIKLFEFFDANQWYLKENQYLLESLIKKLDYLASKDSLMANSVASDFEHFRELVSSKVNDNSDSESDTPLVRKKRKWSNDSSHSDYYSPTKLFPRKKKAIKTVLNYNSDSESASNNTTSFNYLPWDTVDDLPSSQKILSELKGFKPVKCSKYDFVKEVRLFLYIADITSGVENKLLVIRHLFNFLAVNKWFMNDNERFHNVVINKLDEFSQYDHPEAVKLANDFAYFKDLANRDIHLEPLIQTESDYEKGDFLGTNGDSLPYPKVTKEQLDREIDDYMIARQAAKIIVKSNYLNDSESS